MLSSKALSLVSRAVFHPWFRVTRGQTLGVRILVKDIAGRILLVRHSYGPGWLFPGGGVMRSETMVDAALRELREETGVVTNARPQMFGVYANFRSFPGDHVALFVAHCDNDALVHRSLEIAESGFFEITGLPDGTTGGTQRRIDEVMNDKKPAENW